MYFVIFCSINSGWVFTVWYQINLFSVLFYPNMQVPQLSAKKEGGDAPYIQMYVCIINWGYLTLGFLLQVEILSEKICNKMKKSQQLIFFNLQPILSLNRKANNSIGIIYSFTVYLISNSNLCDLNICEEKESLAHSLFQFLFEN